MAGTSCSPSSRSSPPKQPLGFFLQSSSSSEYLRQGSSVLRTCRKQSTHTDCSGRRPVPPWGLETTPPSPGKEAGRSALQGGRPRCVGCCANTRRVGAVPPLASPSAAVAPALAGP
uniref:Uncharacterized protein n=1 Tax=Alexandrium monilatum TaxID=311494 RepID=A0A7S4SGQ7_9DINO